METIKQLTSQAEKGNFRNIYPIAYIDGIIDKTSKEKLSDILIRYNSIYIPWQGDVKSTRSRVNILMRRKGLWITYVNDKDEIVSEIYKGLIEDITKDDNWSADINWETVAGLDYIRENASKIPNGAVLPEHLSPGLQQLISESKTITNLVDDEDLESTNNVIKFKDKEYNKELASGLGRKILRKNWVNGKNVLTQEMINKPNTEYVIQYDFDFNGNSVTIPKNSILNFQGGAISNGILTGNNTTLNAKRVKIFENIKFKGTFIRDTGFPEWAGAYPNTGEDLSDKLQAIIDGSICETLLFGQGEYCFKHIKIGGYSDLGNGLKNINLTGVGRNATILSCISTEGTKDNRNRFIEYYFLANYVSIDNLSIINKGNDYNDAIVSIHPAPASTDPSGGLWYANFERLRIANFYDLINFKALDDNLNGKLRDVANQHLTFRDITFSGAKHLFVDVVGQFGQQGGFYNCFFYEIKNIEYAISALGNSIGTSDGSTLKLENCCFVGTPTEALIKLGGTIQSHLFLSKCNIENLTTNLVSLLPNSSTIYIIENIFQNCNIPTLVDKGGTHFSINIKNNEQFSTKIGKVIDASLGSISNNVNIVDDGSLNITDKNYYRVYFGPSAITNFPFSHYYPSSLEAIIPNKSYGGNSIIGLSLVKHSAVSRNVILLVDSQSNPIKWVSLGQKISLIFISGLCINVITSIDLRGTNADLKEIISNGKGLFKGLEFFNTDDNSVYIYDGTKFNIVSPNSGNQRPASVNIGYCFFDTSLKKPIWFNGSKWVDATGTEV